MVLGVFLAIGESFRDFASKGQDDLIVKQNLTSYLRVFEKVYVFSYENENNSPLPNVVVLPNKWGLHRFIYSLMLPIIYSQEIRSCNVLRGLQITGGIPASVSRLIYSTPFIVNYGFNYRGFAKKEGKNFHSVLYQILEPIILKLSDSVITTTTFLTKKIRTQKKRTFFIPNGVDTKLFAPDGKNKSELAPIVFIGRLESMKNLDCLIRAVGLLEKKHKILFIGNGSKKSVLLSLATKMKVNLVIKKAIPHSLLPKYLASASMFILPSFEEGHPKALIEAMSSGLPVIGNHVTGIKEIIKHGQNGLVFDGTPSSLAFQIQKVIQDKQLRKKISQGARQYALSCCSLEVVSKKERDLLLSVAKSHCTV